MDTEHLEKIRNHMIMVCNNINVTLHNKYEKEVWIREMLHYDIEWFYPYEINWIIIPDIIEWRMKWWKKWSCKIEDIEFYYPNIK